jgi:membrane peptidoglycan carboxypeptidase
MKHRLRLPLKVVTITIIAILSIESIAFTGAYLTAFRYLQQHDPRKGTSLSEMRVFFHPKTLSRGETIDRDSIISHLITIGFHEHEGSDPATFSTSQNKLIINSRIHEFPNVTIAFGGHRITSILVNGQEVDRVDIEPEAMVSFLRFMPDEVAHRTRIRRMVIQPNEVPETLSDAICSSEDHRFYKHNGIDELGMFAGALKLHGGSTVTQQLMKNEVLDEESKSVFTRILFRKVKEIPLALAAERLMTKPEIMAAYVSSCYMGHVPDGPDIHGFAAAALEFFDSDLKSLSLGQYAILAGMVDHPADYVSAARKGDYSLLRDRRARVLGLMHRNFPDKYTENMIAHANAEPLEFSFASESNDERPLDMVSKQFQNFAAAQVRQVVDAATDVTNLRVYTSIDPELQIAAHKAVIDQLARLDVLVAAACRKQQIDPRDVAPIQAALVAIDAQTGEILAMVGGRDGELNFATRRRSPGSAIKPFVYLKAIERGMHNGTPFTAATIIDPANDPVYGTYRPSRNIGIPARARVQLAASFNGGAVVAANDAGISDVRDFIYTLTNSRAHDLTGMLAIGGAAGSEVTLLDLVSGATVFPSGGKKLTATAFASVYQNEKKLNPPRIAPLRVTDRASAYVVTQMLRSVLQPGGTAPYTLTLAGLPMDAPIAGKSGSGQVADLTFVGFSPRIVVGVWVGMPKNIPALNLEEGFSGAGSAMPIWAAFMRAVKHYRHELLEGDFVRPSNIKVLRIDASRGCATDGPGIDEVFVAGREPNPCH